LERACDGVRRLADAGTEHREGDVLGLDAHGHRAGCIFYVALDEGDVRLAVQDVFVSDDTKCAVIGRQLRLGDAADKRLLLDTIANKISDRNDL